MDRQAAFRDRHGPHAGSAGEDTGPGRRAAVGAQVGTLPLVIVAEFAYRGDGDRGPFAVPCVFVLRVRDGQIVASRDYTDHLGFARIGGRLDDLFAQLKG